jgi:hypothetical protein
MLRGCTPKCDHQLLKEIKKGFEIHSEKTVACRRKRESCDGKHGRENQSYLF